MSAPEGDGTAAGRKDHGGETCVSGVSSRQKAVRHTRASRFAPRASEIRNPDGSVVFRQTDIEVPADWSQVACDVLAQKYFRKAGVPADLGACPAGGRAAWLWRKQPAAGSETIGENSAKQVFDRLAGTWTYWGWKGGYFDTEADARAFHDELCFMLATQKAAPNSPQWFNTGLHWAYGIDGPSQGHYYVDHVTRPADEIGLGLRAPAAARLLHPEHQRRSRQRRRDHGSLDARSAPVQIWLRHRHEFLELCAARTRNCRAAASHPG